MSDLKLALIKLMEEKDSSLCPVGKIINALDADTSAALESVLNSTASTRDIHGELIKAGYKIGRDTLSSHRNKWCRCNMEESNGQK